MPELLPSDMRPGSFHGRLTVLFYFDSDNVLARCECGGEITRQASSFRAGQIQSCGCLVRGRKPGSRNSATRIPRTPEYKAWLSAKQRIFNRNGRQWLDYGGRGLTMDPEWAADFHAFLAHVGRKPSPELTLDRIDNDLGYVPGNVRWATRSEQMYNQRRSRRYAT